MTIRLKLILAVLPLLLAVVAGLGGWHYATAAAGVEGGARLYLTTLIDNYIDSELQHHHSLLGSMGVEKIPSFVLQYQLETLEAAKRMATRHHGDFVVADREGRLLLATDGLTREVGDELAHRSVTLDGGLSYRHLRINDGKDDLLYVGRRFEPWQWSVLFVIDGADYHATLDRILISTIVTVGLLGLILAGILYGLSQRLLLRPIAELRGAAQRIAGGEAIGSIPIHSRDELGELARGMERMAREIREAHATLERRVQERTAQLAAAGRRLEGSNKELQDFAYVISHDLQEPLRMVSSYLQLLERRYHGRLDRDADEFIGFAVDGARRMSAMIEGLLQYSRVATQGVPFQTIDLGQALDQALANLQLVIEEGGAEVSRAPLPTVAADPTQMQRLFQNLIANALKFRGEAPPRVRVEARRQGEEWVFSVCDNGIGIPPDQAERIFVMFQRLHDREQFPGMGMGLAVCRRIVERHGGRIWVESAPGEGASFRFTLAAGAGGQEDVATAELAAPPSTEGTTRENLD